MIVKHFFDPDTYTLSYIVHNKGNQSAIIIDPVWDIDIASGNMTTKSVDILISYLKDHSLTPEICLETHAHADHISGAQILKRLFPSMKVAVSSRITSVQETFAKVFNIESDVPADGSQFDYLFEDFEEIEIAGLSVKSIPTPGHTPACSSYLVEDALFTGDAIFMPDYGTGRCDFPGGDATKLYNSITKNLYTLPADTRVFVGHDYQPGGRDLKYQSTIGEQKENNIQLPASQTESNYVHMRESRDKTLNAPRLLLPSIQVNIRAGHLPAPEKGGISYLKLPLTTD